MSERLTVKYDDGSYGIFRCDNRVEDKLGKIEDIEEELGIDLITLFKAIISKDGIKWENKYGFISTLDKEEIEEIKNVLTKEELDKRVI